MPWITDLDLKQRLLDTLQKAEFDTSGAWETIVTDANNQAYGDIVTILTRRGFSIGQINQWDRRAEYNIALGIFWALTTAGGTKDYSDVFISKFDKRPELMGKGQMTGQSFCLTIAGVSVDPAGKLDKAKLVSMKTEGEIFTMDMRL